MSAVRAVAGADSWSMSTGLRSYLSCCFRKKETASATSSDLKAAPDASEPSPGVVQCRRPSDDDDAQKACDDGDKMDHRRPEADGASYHSTGTDKANISSAADQLAADMTSSHGAEAADHSDMGSSVDVGDIPIVKPAGSDWDSGSFSSGQSPLNVNTRSSMSSVGSAGRDREVTAPVDVVGGHHQPDDDDDDAVVAVDKGSRSVSRSSRHSGHASDDADDRSRASYSVRFAPNDEMVDETVAVDVAAASQTPLSRCGSVRLEFRYDRRRKRLAVVVREALDLPDEERSGSELTEVHLVLLPAKRTRHKTHAKPGTNPTFDDNFHFRVPPDDLNSMGLRVRAYGGDRLRRDRLVGEKFVAFSSLDLDDLEEQGQGQVQGRGQSLEKLIELEPRSNIEHTEPLGYPKYTEKVDSVGSLSSAGSTSSRSMHYGDAPELMLGLAYNESTGRLSVEVVKGSNFKNLASSKPPDTSVKLALMSSSGKEMARSKSTVRRGQPNPLFKETFMFQVPQVQLSDVTLMVSVNAVRSLKRRSEMIGWFSLGRSSSCDEASSHWSSMKDSNGEQVCRWHSLIEP